MRAYVDMDDSPDDEEYSRVVPMRSPSHGRSTAMFGRSRPEPWTPRDATVPTATRPPATSPASLEPRFTRTHRWMIGAFVIICVGMVLGMLMVRLWDEVNRTIAAISTDTPAARAAATATPVRISATPPAATPGPAGTPAVTTEIRVLQPNYTVAPGDTLGSIARRHGTSVDALASINNLENRNSLSVGQKLIIP